MAASRKNKNSKQIAAVSPKIATPKKATTRKAPKTRTKKKAVSAKVTAVKKTAAHVKKEVPKKSATPRKTASKRTEPKKSATKKAAKKTVPVAKKIVSRKASVAPKKERAPKQSVPNKTAISKKTGAASVPPAPTRRSARLNKDAGPPPVKHLSLFQPRFPVHRAPEQRDLQGFPILSTNNPSVVRRDIGRKSSLTALVMASLSHPMMALGFQGVVRNVVFEVRHGITENTFETEGAEGAREGFKIVEHFTMFDEIEQKESLGGLPVAIETDFYYASPMTHIYTEDLDECHKKFVAHLKYVFGAANISFVNIE